VVPLQQPLGQVAAEQLPPPEHWPLPLQVWPPVQGPQAAPPLPHWKLFWVA
jgi:hypothetical protein